MNMGPRWLGPRWLGADLTRDFFQTGAEVVVGPRWLGAEVTRGRGGSGAEVSEFHIVHCNCFFVLFIVVKTDLKLTMRYLTYRDKI